MTATTDDEVRRLAEAMCDQRPACDDCLDNARTAHEWVGKGESVEPVEVAAWRHLTDLARAATLLDGTREEFDTLGLDTLASIYVALEDVRRDLADYQAALATAIGDEMGAYRATVDGVGTLERHKKKNRRNWDTDDLVRVVLDSRLVDEETGEIADETPVDKVRAVWNLGTPRTTALQARHIDPDEFCEVTVEPGWTIRIHS